MEDDRDALQEALESAEKAKAQLEKKLKSEQVQSSSWIGKGLWTFSTSDSDPCSYEVT